MDTEEIANRYHRVLERVQKATQRVGRDPRSVTLVVVTKAHPLEAVRAVVAAGARHLGENYVQEAAPKIAALQGQGLTWHMIGHVQSRKAKDVVVNFSWVHSLDREKLARRLSRFAAEAGVTLPVLLECNLSGEPTKSGFHLWDESAWPAFAESVEGIATLPGLHVCGLMTMPPYLPDPEAVRPYFRRLRELRDWLAHRLPEVPWEHLSMGMSHDFEIAIEEGATMVRVGTAIMGPRIHNPE